MRHLLVQLETPGSIRGRASTFNSVFIGAVNESCEFESGITAGWFGLEPAMTPGVTDPWMWRFPMLRAMNRFPGAAACLLTSAYAPAYAAGA